MLTLTPLSRRARPGLAPHQGFGQPRLRGGEVEQRAQPVARPRAPRIGVVHKRRSRRAGGLLPRLVPEHRPQGQHIGQGAGRPRDLRRGLPARDAAECVGDQRLPPVFTDGSGLPAAVRRRGRRHVDHGRDRRLSRLAPDRHRQGRRRADAVWIDEVGGVFNPNSGDQVFFDGLQTGLTTGKTDMWNIRIGLSARF